MDVPATVGDDLSGAAPAVRVYAKAMEAMFGPVQDEAAWRLGVNFYLNCTRDVDRSIDIVLDALTASGEADRTVVIFTSDHGEMAGSHGLRQIGTRDQVRRYCDFLQHRQHRLPQQDRRSRHR